VPLAIDLTPQTPSDRNSPLQIFSFEKVWAEEEKHKRNVLKAKDNVTVFEKCLCI